ncbi:MAG TPA: methionyl-tRNA formyltransferase, partial [Burkholderiales bacterium]|nr:methionyl-tRNA formyltransferase [Burkholderiales bacterium]
MRLVFAGTPEFAERALAALLDSGHEVCLVLTQPDRPAGRGMRPVGSAVKQLALARGLELFQPETLKDGAAQARVASARADCLVVAAYGLILPLAVLRLAPYGALNIHASLLPRWRGAAPIQRALLAGDTQTGISIMQMDAGLDTGPVLAQRQLAIAPEDDAQSLHDKLAALGAQMIVAALDDIAHGRAQAVPQPVAGMTYAHKIGKADTVIDWR